MTNSSTAGWELKLPADSRASSKRAGISSSSSAPVSGSLKPRLKVRSDLSRSAVQTSGRPPKKGFRVSPSAYRTPS
jgi:hypothetical protein